VARRDCNITSASRTARLIADITLYDKYPDVSFFSTINAVALKFTTVFLMYRIFLYDRVICAARISIWKNGRVDRPTWPQRACRDAGIIFVYYIIRNDRHRNIPICIFTSRIRGIIYNARVNRDIWKLCFSIHSSFTSCQLAWKRARTEAFREKHTFALWKSRTGLTFASRSADRKLRRVQKPQRYDNEMSRISAL
jgi:hypothetical protein